MVGDRWRDIEAGQRAQCKTVFIDQGYSERKPVGADFTASSLSDALTWIIENTQPTQEKLSD
jgi:D-glycero-D-manno-heptose 1,7-bisphosphate phosphatase